MEKRNLLEEYMKKVEQEALECGVEFKETVQNDTGDDVVLDEQSYVNDLNSKAMLSDEMFKIFENKFNMNWEHVRQVSDLSAAKELLKKQLKKEENDNVASYNEKIKQLALKLRTEAEKLK